MKSAIYGTGLMFVIDVQPAPQGSCLIGNMNTSESQWCQM